MPLQRLNTAKGIIAKYQGKAYHHTLMQRTDADAYVNARGADGDPPSGNPAPRVRPRQD